MLTVIGAAPGAVAKSDYAQAWRNSAELIEVKKHLADLRGQPKPKPAENLSKHREFAAPFHLQLWFVTYRVFQQLYRTPSYIVSGMLSRRMAVFIGYSANYGVQYSKMTLVVSSGLFIGFTFFRVGTNLGDLQNQMFSIFMLFIVFGNLVNQAMVSVVSCCPHSSESNAMDHGAALLHTA
jgi:ATP-binding cassette subfamily G (WHITE) protein 2 (PDR)